MEHTRRPQVLLKVPMRMDKVKFCSKFVIHTERFFMQTTNRTTQNGKCE